MALDRPTFLDEMVVVTRLLGIEPSSFRSFNTSAHVLEAEINRVTIRVCEGNKPVVMLVTNGS